jgi:hypothetical protein
LHFTYDSYSKLVSLLLDNDYKIVNYHNCDNFNRVAILRHDVDIDLAKALDFAEFEHSLGVTSTYFLLLSSNFYNINSKRSQDMIHQIQNLGHAVGLHFDEKNYPIKSKADFEIYAKKEIDLFKQVVTGADKSLSMHRPSELALNGNFNLGDFVNSYSEKFFKEYKYVSDSRMNWREDIFTIIKNKVHQRLHILTHPIWYYRTEISMKEVLTRFLSRKNDEMYCELGQNVRDLSEVLPEQPKDYSSF